MTPAVETPPETPVTPPATPPATPPESTPPAAVTPPATPPAEPPPATPPATPEGLEPQAPASYTLTVPEKSPLAASDVERIKADAKAFGMTNAQAQKYLESQSKLVQDAVAQLEREHGELKADPVLGGANFEATQAHVNSALVWMFGDKVQEAREFFDRLALGNNRLLVAGLAKLGKATATDTAIRPGAGGTPPERKETKDVLFGSSSKA